MSEAKPWLRPSNLPKLALCGHYRPEPVAGPAADRGTKMDIIFRGLISHESAGDLVLDDEEREAVKWAVDTAKALAGGKPLEAREEMLRTGALGLTGTADLLCVDGNWSADLKSGQIRNYLEQQALYALGFMMDNFADEWTVYLLFCDQQQVVTLRFTLESAMDAVKAALAKANGEEPPVLNDYCGWCAARFTCPVRRESMGLIAFDGPDALPLVAMPSVMLRDFVLRGGIVEDFVKEARDILRDRCVNGEKTQGVSLTSKKGSCKAPPQVVELYARDLGTGDIFAAYGSMSEAKFKEIWERKLPGKPFPSEKMEQLPGSSFVTVRRPKEAK